MAHEHEEGWYTDPFGRHEARWLSEGVPTKLVRDKGIEAYDEPPDEAPTQSPVRIEAADTSSAGGDLRRADDAERDEPYGSAKANRAMLDILDQMPKR